MRFPCNEIAMSDDFEKQILAPTVPRYVHANDLSFDISGGQESIQLSRVLRLLPLLRENAANSGLA